MIPDTGADSSVLRDADCQAFDLFNSPYFTGLSSGVIGGSVTTLIYLGKAEIDGLRVPAFLQPVAAGQERLVVRAARQTFGKNRVHVVAPAGKKRHDAHIEILVQHDGQS